MTRGAAAGIPGEEQRGKDAALWKSGADGLESEMFPQLHIQPPARMEICNPPAGGVQHISRVSLSSSNARMMVVKAELNFTEQNPGIGS